MSDLPFYLQTLPPFSKLKYSDIYESIISIIDENNNIINQTLKSNKNNWDNSVLVFEELSIKLSNAWSIISHLNSVQSCDEVREFYEKSLSKIIEYSVSLEQNQDINNLYKNILDNNKLSLTQEQISLLNQKILEFKLSGVDLEEEKKLQYKQLSEDISRLSTKFNNNILDCIDDWTYHVTDLSKLSGIPADILNIASNKAKQQGLEGYMFGLDQPTYIHILKYCKNRDLRKAFHYAYVTIASENGPHDSQYDNEKLIYDILCKKLEQAKLLGYKNYAEYSLANKMVKDPNIVLEFLNNLLNKAKTIAKKELDELKLFAKSNKYSLPNNEDLKPWDISFYSELQKNKMFDLSNEQLKQYFSLEKVLSGLFDILHKLYNINFKSNTTADVWHDDVKCYDLFDKEYNLIGHIYLDLFARDKKKNGAWMDECRVKCNTNNLQQLPVAYLTCNFTAPISTTETSILLHHEEVVTLFHEFGHCLQHLLTKINLPTISGINGVPWDAVELASQFHENFCWDYKGLEFISEHIDTKEPMPSKMIKQVIKQKNYQSGLFLMRQIIFGLFDMRLHIEFHPDNGIKQIRKLLKQIRDDINIMPYAEYDSFQNSFSHIFAGGYAAGYYSYLWAEVLASNCFDKFNSLDNIFDSTLGKRFLDIILSTGGSIDYTTAVPEFCGHEIDHNCLLKHYQIL